MFAFQNPGKVPLLLGKGEKKKPVTDGGGRRTLGPISCTNSKKRSVATRGEAGNSPPLEGCHRYKATITWRNRNNVKAHL